MAETIISAIVGDVVSRVISHVIGHYYSYRHQQQSTVSKLQVIRHKLVRIHSAVEEARGKQITNDGALQWLSELIDAEYQGNYLLDSFKHDLDEDGEDDDATVVSSLSRFNPAKRARISVRNLLPRCRDVTIDEIDGVAERLQGVSDGLREFIMFLGTCQPVRRPLATNIFRHGQMFGRHVEKERIISFLLHDDVGDGDTRLAVLPVVGDTGVGKTTLVQHACDDARVRCHFQVIMLLDFAYTSAAAAATSERSIVLRPKHVIGDAGGIDVSDPLQMVDWDFGRRKFLMVFEDVDMRQKQVLEDLLPRRRCTAGSKIIITTNNRLAATIGTVKPIMLQALPFPEYWFFFRAHAFSGRDLEESSRLVAAGKAIAKKLDGSFFGAKIVGGLLMNNPNPSFWRAVSSSSSIDDDMSALGDGVNYIMDLSKSLLPRNMRMCQVIVSKDRFSQTELAGLHGASAAQMASWSQGYGFARVLLCESLLPFYNLYYIADCTADLVNYSRCDVVLPCVSLVQFNSSTRRVTSSSISS